MNRLRARSVGGSSGSGVQPLAPLYSRVVFYGDGISSEGSANGLKNAPFHALILLNGRVRPAALWMQCKSGGDMNTIYARREQAIKQQPEIFVFASQGHNDLIKSSDYVAQMVKWERNLDAVLAGLRSDCKIIVCTTVKSAVSTETTGGDWQTAVNNAQLAAIAARQLTDSRIVLCDTYAAYNDPANMSPSSDTNKVHPDERGGYAIGLAIFNAIDPIVETETKANILADITSKAFRSANIHPDNTFSGTSGTKSGTVAPTGNWPTGQRITNNLTNGTSVAVACTTPDSSTAQAVLTGTPASENSIVLDDTASISLIGTVKGAFYEWREGVFIDNGSDGAAGIDNLGLVLSSFGNMGGAIPASSTNSAVYSRKIDTIISAVGCSFGATQPPAANPSLQVRYRASAANSRIQISKPALFQVELQEYAPMYYIGDDTIVGTNLQYRVTGTGVSGSSITAATVATLTMEPGVWAGGNADWANAFTRVMKINGSTVSGAFSAGWTYNAAGTLTAGQTVTFEITGTNGLGSDTRTLTFTVV